MSSGVTRRQKLARLVPGIPVGNGSSRAVSHVGWRRLMKLHATWLCVCVGALFAPGLSATPIDNFRAAVTREVETPLPDEEIQLESSQTRGGKNAAQEVTREKHVAFLNALAPGNGFRIGVGGLIDYRGQHKYSTTPQGWMAFACSEEGEFSRPMFRWSTKAAPFTKFVEAFNVLMAVLENDSKKINTPVFVKFYRDARNAQIAMTEIVRTQYTGDGGRRAIRVFLANCGLN